MPTIADYHILDFATGTIYEGSSHHLFPNDTSTATIEFQHVTVLKKNDVLRVDYAERLCKFFVPVKLSVLTMNRNKELGIRGPYHNGQFFLGRMPGNMHWSD